MTIRDGFTTGSVLLAVALAVTATAIIAAKASREWRTRRQAGLIAEVRPRVLTALNDHDDGAALEFRGRRGSMAESIAISLLPKLRGADRDALAAILEDGGVLPDARRHLSSRRAARRQRAAELLGAAGTAGATELLVPRLRDRDRGVRIAAAQALGRIGDPEAVGPLLTSLDQARVPANTIALAILRIGAPGGDRLRDALDDAHPHTRGLVAELVGSLGLTDTIDDLTRLLDDPNIDVRRHAARGLARLGLPSSVQAVVKRLETELDRADALDEELVVALIGALGHIGHPSAVPVLTRSFLRTHRLSFAAAGALSSLGPSRSLSSGPWEFGIRGEDLVGAPVTEIIAARPFAVATSRAAALGS